MQKYELSKLDLEIINEAFDVAIENAKMRGLTERKLKHLQNKFRSAHIGWLETTEAK